MALFTNRESLRVIFLRDGFAEIQRAPRLKENPRLLKYIIIMSGEIVNSSLVNAKTKKCLLGEIFLFLAQLSLIRRISAAEVEI